MEKTYEISYKFKWLVENPYWDTKEHESSYTIRSDEDADLFIDLKNYVCEDMLAVPEIVNINNNLYENKIYGLNDKGTVLVVAYDIKVTVKEVKGD